MAIVEKRQLFRIDDELKISYLRLSDEDVNDAIQQLSTAESRKSLFPTIKPDLQPIKTNITVFGLSFYSKEIFTEDSYITLAIQLNLLVRPLLAVGQVVYCKYDTTEANHKTGVKFQFLSKPDMQTLEDYLVSKLQAGLSKQLSANKLRDEESWLFDRDAED